MSGRAYTYLVLAFALQGWGPWVKGESRSLCPARLSLTKMAPVFLREYRGQPVWFVGDT